MGKIAKILLCYFLIVSGSCSQYKTKPVTKRSDDSYFSIAGYAKYQWNTYHGQAFGIIKRVYMNGKVDSVITNAVDMDWAPVLKIFFETDISDKKFLGKYDYSTFVDESTAIRSFYYEANDPNLYTKTVQVTASELSGRVKSVYIEAEKQDGLGASNVKLLYTPLESISIQEMETTRTGDRREMRVVYQFL